MVLVLEPIGQQELRSNLSEQGLHGAQQLCSIPGLALRYGDTRQSNQARCHSTPISNGQI